MQKHVLVSARCGKHARMWNGLLSSVQKGFVQVVRYVRRPESVSSQGYYPFFVWPWDFSSRLTNGIHSAMIRSECALTHMRRYIHLIDPPRRLQQSAVQVNNNTSTAHPLYYISTCTISHMWPVLHRLAWYTLTLLLSSSVSMCCCSTRSSLSGSVEDSPPSLPCHCHQSNLPAHLSLIHSSRPCSTRTLVFHSLAARLSIDTQ